MPRKVFVANEILTAGEVNTNLMDQAVMVFADAAARTAALGSPSEGMVTYLEDTDSLELYTTVWGPVSPAITRADLPAGSVLQVVSTTKTDTFSTTSTSFLDITGFTLNITPSSTSSKIMVFVDLQGGGSGGNAFHSLVRGSTNLAIGDSAGTRVRSSAVYPYQLLGNANVGVNISFLDSPSATVSTTYKVQMRVESAATGYVNRSHSDADGGNLAARTASTITLMEVAG